MIGATGGSGTGPALRRELTLPLLTLYGIGTTIGAGIYVLVGATAAKAGFYAPVSFILAAGVVAFTGLSYAELATRYPVSAGEAAYVRAGFNSVNLTRIVGITVALSGIVSAAAVSIGAAAYIRHFIDLPVLLVAGTVILALGLVAAWGIVESVVMAAIFTLVEVFGLCLVLYFALSENPDLVKQLDRVVPPLSLGAWSGIYAAGLLAFFAFVGFEDMANVAEEVVEPRKTLPRAIILTLVVTTAIYVAVVSVVVLSVPMDVLTKSHAPLALIFEAHGTLAKQAFSVIAIIATANGILVQMIMASRVFYGLAAQGELPAKLAIVDPRTRTPLYATALCMALVLAFALLLPIADLAELTSALVLAVFVMVNLALIRLKWRSNVARDVGERPTRSQIFIVPRWVPAVGFVSSLALLISGLV